MKKIYIHYGSTAYDMNRLWNAVVNKREQYDHLGQKPHGLWASPEQSNLSWKNWCESEEFRLETLDKSFKFKLAPNAKILRINNLKEARKFILEKKMPFLSEPGSYHVWQELDLPQIYSCYDGMEVIMSNDYINFHNNQIFYTWDVDSLCVWHPGMIIPVK